MEWQFEHRLPLWEGGANIKLKGVRIVDWGVRIYGPIVYFAFSFLFGP